MGLWWGDFQNPVVEDSKKAGIQQILKTTSGQMRLNLDGEVAWSGLDHYRCETAGQGAGAPDERQRLVEAITGTGGKKTVAARLLGISRVTLWKLLKAHHIQVDKMTRG